jgi:hypothetical protein
MDSISFEYKSLALITLIGYTLSVIVGISGLMFPTASYYQLLCYQINDALAIMASVIAARYTGLRGLHVAASAFILMGITHGVSMASSGLNSFNIERGLVIIMPMTPALILLFWCSLFPVWLRFAAIIPIILFLYMYQDVINGGKYYSIPLMASYLTLMAVEIMWGYFIFLDWKKLQVKNTK